MKSRSLSLAAVVTAGLIATQVAGAGSAHAAGANGGVWKTTNFDTTEAGTSLPAVQRLTDGQTGLWLPVVQKVSCAACYSGS